MYKGGQWQKCVVDNMRFKLHGKGLLCYGEAVEEMMSPDPKLERRSEVREEKVFFYLL